MADRVIIAGARRGPSVVPVREIVQMAGRCARDHYGDRGKVDIVVGSGEVQKIRKQIKDPNSFIVKSQLDNDRYDEMFIHVLAEIARGAGNIAELDKWFSRSFFLFQTNRHLPMNAYVNILKGMKMIKVKGADISPTRLGMSASHHYYHPCHVHQWVENFDFVFRSHVSDIQAAWALSNIKTFGGSSMSSEQSKFAYGYWDEARREGLDMFPGTSVVGQVYYNLLRGKPNVGVTQKVRSIKFDFRRLISLLKDISSFCCWKSEFFDMIEFRIDKGIPYQLYSLCHALGISKHEAQTLTDLGIETPEEAAYQDWDCDEYDENYYLFQRIQKAAKQWTESQPDSSRK